MPRKDVTAKKPRVDISRLAQEWDRVEAIREYLRGPGCPVLFPEGTKVIVKTTREAYVEELLTPILLRSASLTDFPQPKVHDLREQLVLLYKKASRTIDVDDKIIIDDSWYIRKFLVLVKSRARKEKVSTAPHLNLIRNHGA